MLAVAGQPPAGDQFREWKFDGHRCRSDTGRRNGPRLVSRGGHVVTDRFPEVADALAEVLGDRMAVLDGELVCPGEGGRPDFEALQRRARTSPTAARRAAHPVTLVVFDLLALDDRDLTGLPLRDRRAHLERLGLAAHPRLQLSPVFTDVAPDVLVAAAREHGMEGLVSKAPGSRYAAGARSKAWVKTVLTETEVFTVAGHCQGRARRPGGVGSLLLGSPTPDGGIEYVGEVGTGWTRTEHARLVAALGELGTESCPFTRGADRLPGDARFVAPVLRGRVAYREHRPGGLLRHPSWKGLVFSDEHDGAGPVSPG